MKICWSRHWFLETLFWSEQQAHHLIKTRYLIGISNLIICTFRQKNIFACRRCNSFRSFNNKNRSYIVLKITKKGSKYRKTILIHIFVILIRFSNFRKKKNINIYILYYNKVIKLAIPTRNKNQLSLCTFLKMLQTYIFLKI